MIRVLEGDCRETLKGLPDESVQCVVTSPPYWGLRDYGTAKWEGGQAECDHREVQAQNRPGRETPGGRGGSFPTTERGYRDVCGKCGAVRQDRQLGLERTPQEYIAKLVDLFREVRRVLRADGTLWLNLGDCYNAYNGGAGPGSKLSKTQTDQRPRLASGFGLQDKSLKPKDLIGIPWRVAFALQEDGWYLRQCNIWAKPNGMPESVRDRSTVSHEYVFHLAKSERYFYDTDAARTPPTPATETRLAQNVDAQEGSERANGGAKTNGNMKAVQRRSFNDRWDALEKADQQGDGSNLRSVWWIAPAQFRDAHFAVMPPRLAEICIVAGSRKGDTVLDPFFGAGTTGLIADRLGRDCIGIELNPTYAEMARRRIHSDNPLFTDVA